MERIPMDPAVVEAYVRRSRTGPCFVCAILAGEPGYDHEQIFYDDGEHIGFLNRYPTVPGWALVAPRRHVEHNARDLTEEEYLRLQTAVYRVVRLIEAVVPSERTYVLSLGSQQGNTHVHWHVVPLPPGTPYEEQQFHALRAENGLIAWSPAQARELADRLRVAAAAG